VGDARFSHDVQENGGDNPMPSSIGIHGDEMKKWMWAIRYASLVVALFACLPSWAGQFPPGPYSNNSEPIPAGGGCQPTKMDHGTLTAVCVDFFGNKVNTSLANADRCVAHGHEIENINGSLRCLLSYVPVRGRHPYRADILSIPEWIKTPKGESKTYRIDQPRVDVPRTEYKSVTFKPGDTFVIFAGGCVQTGGGWKSYVYPATAGNAAWPDLVFAGTVYVEDVIPSPMRMYEAMNRSYLVPANAASQKDYFLRLGYEIDKVHESGYYNHEDGLEGQCRGVGPAWVEVKVMSGDEAKTGPAWLPTFKPFDLVWDMKNEDVNGLPLNPKWAYQLWTKGFPLTRTMAFAYIPSLLPDGWSPDFLATCPPFSQPVNGTPQSLNCTVQTVYYDQYPSNLLSIGGLCPGAVMGHVNWQIATYTGWMAWDGWSGDWPLGDGDYNLTMQTPNANGMTAGNWAEDSAGFWTTALALEFKGGETLNNAGDPFWQNLQSDAESAPPWWIHAVPPGQLFNDGSGINGTLKGVATGLIGIDAVEGSKTESHPVFAIALRTSVQPVFNPTGPGQVQEHWVFFLRNSGNEGMCSDSMHYWPSAANNEYAIQLPWPPGATSVKSLGGRYWPWQSQLPTLGIFRTSDPGWTVIEVRFPDDGHYGVDGHVDLLYEMSGGYRADEEKRAAPRPPEKKTEFNLDQITSRIADPAVRAKFISDLNALKPPSVPRPAARAAIPMDTEIKTLQRIPGAASRGVGTPGRSSPDPAKQQLDEARQKLLGSYKPLVDATPPTKQ